MKQADVITATNQDDAVSIDQYLVVFAHELSLPLLQVLGNTQTSTAVNQSIKTAAQAAQPKQIPVAKTMTTDD